MLKTKLMTICVTMAMLAICSASQASLITPTGVSGTGTYNNSAGIIIDGTFPAEGSAWSGSDKVWWNGTAVTLTVDLGALYQLDDIVVSVDNNDTYLIEYSSDNTSFSTLFSIPSSIGEIASGMDTMSTISGDSEYESSLDFSSVQSVRYLRISATGGDDKYAVGELQAYGVPEPATMSLLGLGGLALLRCRRK